MNRYSRTARLAACCGILVGSLSACATSDNVTVHGSVGMYYGAGYYNPWYYGPGYGPPVTVRPMPPARPVHPEQPIARPPASTRPMPVPTRSGGGRRR